MIATAKILVIDDEPSIVRVVRTALEARRYQALAAYTGTSAIETVAAEAPDCILLDLGLPDVDGVEVCKRLRQWTAVPIIVLSADGADDRKVRALDSGANDYVTKPFSMPELLARVRVALRSASTPRVPEPVVLEVGDLVVDLARHEVVAGGEHLELTPKQFDILALLARWPGRVLTHRTILQGVWGPKYGTESHYLRVYSSQLRKKLGSGPRRPRLVTEPGVGYRLVEPGDDVG